MWVTPSNGSKSLLGDSSFAPFAAEASIAATNAAIIKAANPIQPMTSVELLAGLASPCRIAGAAKGA